MKENNKLQKYEKVNIFAKIRSFFRKLFFKNNTSNFKNIKEEVHLNKNNSDFLNSITIKQQEELNKNIKNISNEFQNKKEKQEFFKYYNDYKSRKISAKDIPISILIKINRMLDEELRIKVEDYNKLEKMLINDDLSK
ncbi:MAG: hypothetical protein IJ223_04890 [Clostridia bacterium]|nr:hypothetical protein [Clostridia bacterium]